MFNTNFRQNLSIVVLGMILTAIFTWPFAINLTSYYTDAGDYATHGSILWYNQDSIKTGRIFSPKDYWHGYQFYPHPFSLTFANNHVFPSLVFAPVYWITNNLPFSVNLYVFLTFVLSFLAAFYTVRYFVGERGDPSTLRYTQCRTELDECATSLRTSKGERVVFLASIIGAFIFTFNPQIMTRFPQHIELLGKFFLPLIFLFAYKLLEKPNFKFSFFLWLAITLNSLTANYFQIFVIIFLPLFAVPFLLSNVIKKNWRYFWQLIKVCLVGLIFVPVLLYFNLPFWDFSVKEGVSRSIDESIFFSARINDWFAPTQNNLFYGGWSKYLHNFREPKDDRGILNYEEHTLFLGILAIILFSLGLKPFYKTKFYKSAFFILGGVSLILTFGPYLNYEADNFKLPFYYLYQMLPLMKGIRAPGRFEYIFYIPFSLIAAFGARKLLEGRKNLTIIIIIMVILILENFIIKDYSTRSGIFSKIDQIGVENISFLKDKNVLHLPIYTIADADVFGKNSIYTNWLTKTGERMMNGNSGYFPPDILAMLFEINSSLDEQALFKLSALRIDYVVIHKDLMDVRARQQFQSNENLYTKGIIFNQFDIVIVDLLKLNLTPKICVFDRDFDIQFGKAAPGGVVDEETRPTYAISLKNISDCFLPSIYEDRYRTVDVEIEGQKRKAHLRMPIIIGPKEQVILSEMGKELRIK